MKKGIIVLLSFLFLAGCQSNNTEIIEYKTYQNEEITISDLSVLILESDYKPTIASLLGYGKKIEPVNKSEEFIDIVLLVTNNSNQEVDLSLQGIKLIGDNINQEASIYTETEDFYTMDLANTIGSKEIRRVHVIVPVKLEEKSDEVKIYFNDNHKYHLELITPEKTYAEVFLGEEIEKEKFIIEIKNYELVTEILPTNKNGDYHYLKIDAATDKFLSLEVKVLNKTDERLDLNEVLMLSNINDYDFSWYLENENQNNFLTSTTLGAKEEEVYKLVTVVKSDFNKSSISGIIENKLVEIKLK